MSDKKNYLSSLAKMMWKLPLNSIFIMVFFVLLNTVFDINCLMVVGARKFGEKFWSGVMLALFYPMIPVLIR